MLGLLGEVNDTWEELIMILNSLDCFACEVAKSGEEFLKDRIADNSTLRDG